MITLITRSIRQGFLAVITLTLLFFVVEPAIATMAEDTFTISQTITAEVSFLTPATDVVLSPSLGGITGGTALGQTQVVVHTSNATGYTMTITASSSLGMIGNASSSNYIRAYSFPGTSTPEFTFTVPANKGYFGYTVEASTTSDLSTAFKDNGSVCGTGALDTVDSCWLNASTSAVTIVNRALFTPGSGATTTLKFRVTINSNPNPTIPNDTYVATTTLTATAN